MQVAELTADELKLLIKGSIEEKMMEMFADPDEGLELKENVKTRLKSSLNEVKQGKRGIPASEVARKIGVDW